MFKALVTVKLRESILDPQGKAVEHAIHSLGFKQTGHVRIGRSVEFRLNVPNREEAERQTHEICRKLLANPVMEDYVFEIKEA